MHEELHKKSVQRVEVHHLTENQKRRRHERAQNWLEHYAEHTQRMIFSDEKPWHARPRMNTRNNRLWIDGAETKADISPTRLKNEAENYGPAVWAFGAINYDGVGPLLLFDRGVYLNSQVSFSYSGCLADLLQLYSDVIIDTAIYPFYRGAHPDGNGWFQQDGHPAHTSRHSMARLAELVRSFRIFPM